MANLFAAWHATPHLLRVPEGESLQDLAARTADAFGFALERYAFEMETSVFVGRDSVNRALLLQLLDQPLSAYLRIAQAPWRSMRSTSLTAAFVSGNHAWESAIFVSP